MKVKRGPHDGFWWGSGATTKVERAFVTLEPSGTPTGWRIVSLSFDRRQG